MPISNIWMAREISFRDVFRSGIKIDFALWLGAECSRRHNLLSTAHSMTNIWQWCEITRSFSTRRKSARCSIGSLSWQTLQAIVSIMPYFSYFLLIQTSREVHNREHMKACKRKRSHREWVTLCDLKGIRLHRFHFDSPMDKDRSFQHRSMKITTPAAPRPLKQIKSSPTDVTVYAIRVSFERDRKDFKTWTAFRTPCCLPYSLTVALGANLNRLTQTPVHPTLTQRDKSELIDRLPLYVVWILFFTYNSSPLSLVWSRCHRPHCVILISFTCLRHSMVISCCFTTAVKYWEATQVGEYECQFRHHRSCFGLDLSMTGDRRYLKNPLLQHSISEITSLKRRIRKVSNRNKLCFVPVDIDISSLTHRREWDVVKVRELLWGLMSLCRLLWEPWLQWFILFRQRHRLTLKRKSRVLLLHCLHWWAMSDQCSVACEELHPMLANIETERLWTRSNCMYSEHNWFYLIACNTKIEENLRNVIRVYVVVLILQKATLNVISIPWKSLDDHQETCSKCFCSFNLSDEVAERLRR